MDYSFFAFSFAAGLAAFFSPCAVALLPAYVTYFLSKSERKFTAFLSFSVQAILGFFTVFGTVGFILLFLGSFIKPLFPYLAIGTGIIIVIIGVMMLFGKTLIKLPHIKYGLNAYLFGIAYAMGALGCTFPLFASVVLIGVQESTFSQGVFGLFAYILGMSVLMIALTATSAVAKEAIERYINKIVPYIYKVSAIILILAGMYMVYYQLPLLF